MEKINSDYKRKTRNLVALLLNISKPEQTVMELLLITLFFSRWTGSFAIFRGVSNCFRNRDHPHAANSIRPAGGISKGFIRL